APIAPTSAARTGDTAFTRTASPPLCGWRLTSAPLSRDRRPQLRVHRHGGPPPPAPGRASVPLPPLHAVPRPRRAAPGLRPALAVVGAAPGAGGAAPRRLPG